MSLAMIGRPGATTELSANDEVFGMMTQNPDKGVLHSPGGLTDANSNTAFAMPFTLATYFTTGNPTAGSTTLTRALSNANAPYKFRVLKARVTMVDEANGLLREAANSCHVRVTQASDSVAAGDISGMRQLEEKSLGLSRTGGEVVAANGSLTVSADVRMGETGSTDTLTFLVELTCIRVR